MLAVRKVIVILENLQIDTHVQCVNFIQLEPKIGIK